MLQKAYVGLIATAATVLAAALLAGCDTTPKTGLARGADLYTTCVPCHGKDGSGNLELRAPQIAGLPQWYVAAELTKFKGDIRGAHPDDAEGHRMRPMARTLYQPGDLDAVAAYVATLPSRWMAPTYTVGDTAAGRQTFSNVCITCHQADGKGNKDLGAPPIAQQSDWYLMAQLNKFHSGMRGANPADTFGQQMRAMSLTLADSTAMHDVVAYVKSLPH